MDKSISCRPLLATFLILFLTAFIAQAQPDQVELYPHAEQERGLWGYIDPTGQIVISPQFQWADVFSEDLAVVRMNGKYGWIDRNGKFAIQPQFDWARPFQRGRPEVKVGHDWGFVDRSGAFVGEVRWAMARWFKDGRAIVTIKGDVKTKQRTGAVDLSGRVIVEPEYETMDDFSEGLSPAKRDGKYGYVDKDGKIAIPFQFERAFSLRAGEPPCCGMRAADQA